MRRDQGVRGVESREGGGVRLRALADPPPPRRRERRRGGAPGTESTRDGKRKAEGTESAKRGGVWDQSGGSGTPSITNGSDSLYASSALLSFNRYDGSRKKPSGKQWSSSSRRNAKSMVASVPSDSQYGASLQKRSHARNAVDRSASVAFRPSGVDRTPTTHSHSGCSSTKAESRAASLSHGRCPNLPILYAYLALRHATVSVTTVSTNARCYRKRLAYSAIVWSQQRRITAPHWAIFTGSFCQSLPPQGPADVVQVQLLRAKQRSPPPVDSPHRHRWAISRCPSARRDLRAPHPRVSTSPPPRPAVTGEYLAQG